MATPVIMPRQGQSVESCILTEWKVKQGDSVSEGDVLAVIETDKASFDLESTASGKVLELFWEADDDVPVLANVLVIGEDGENVEELATTLGWTKDEWDNTVDTVPESECKLWVDLTPEERWALRKLGWFALSWYETECDPRCPKSEACPNN